MMSQIKFAILVSAMLCAFKVKGDEVKKRSDCPVEVIHRGCFYSGHSQLSKELLITDREANSPIQIQWYSYPEYLKRLICRCATAATEWKFTMFSIEYWGECWGINGGDDQIQSLKTSTYCQTTGYTSPCLKDSNKYCTGTANTAYIYKISVQKVPVDGAYSQWSSWSKCTKECGGGTSTRTRECNNPTPAYNGHDCDHLGNAEELKKCNEQACYPYPNADCGTVKQVNKVDTLNASLPVEFCSPFVQCDRTVTFCRVIYPETAKNSDDYVIEVYMYSHATNKARYSRSAGIIFNAHDINNFELIYLRFMPGPCYHFVTAKFENGKVQSIDNKKSECTPLIREEQWMKLILYVNQNGVTLYGNGINLGTTQSQLANIARGGIIARNGDGNWIEYTDYKIFNLQNNAV